MFRCLECGKGFKEPLKVEERHGLESPPFEESYVCPSCKGSAYKPFIKDEISRREMLDSLIDIMRHLNEFEYAVCDTFSETALDDTGVDYARSDLYDLLLKVAGDDEFELPFDIDEKVFALRTEVEGETVFATLTKNIEGE